MQMQHAQLHAFFNLCTRRSWTVTFTFRLPLASSNGHNTWWTVRCSSPTYASAWHRTATGIPLLLAAQQVQWPDRRLDIGVRSLSGTRIFLCQKRPSRFPWALPLVFSMRNFGRLLSIKRPGGLFKYLPPMLKLRMRGAMHPLPHTSKRSGH